MRVQFLIRQCYNFRKNRVVGFLSVIGEIFCDQVRAYRGREPRIREI